jgi:hypothetical protein
MAQLSKEEIAADAILDAATPPTATESSFPEIIKKKPVVKKAPAAKAPAIKKAIALKTTEAAPVSPLAAPKPQAKPNTSNELIKKAWQRINSLGLGIGGKVILLLVIIGIFSAFLQHF